MYLLLSSSPRTSTSYHVYFSENQGKSPGLLDHSASEQIGPFQSITSQKGFLPENESCVLPADRTSKAPAGITGHRASDASVRSATRRSHPQESRTRRHITR